MGLSGLGRVGEITTVHAQELTRRLLKAVSCEVVAIIISKARTEPLYSSWVIKSVLSFGHLQ